jgi:predicted acetyltransferase
MCQMCDLTFFGLAEPQLPMLASYASALEQGWSPSSSRDISGEQLDALKADPKLFLIDLVNQEGMETLPDGTTRPRLPRRLRWMWDGEFCGSINLRWQPGTTTLPPDVHGHIGYSVVPWKRGHGLAKRALRLILREAREVGLDRVVLTTEPENIASQTVILSNGGHRIGDRVVSHQHNKIKFTYEIRTP